MKPNTEINKFLLRLDSDLYDSLRSKAANNGISINELCNQLLQSDTSRNQFGDLVTEFNNILKRQANAEVIGTVLFGSAARGTATASSDRDLLIVLNQNSEISRELYLSWDEFVVSSKGRKLQLGPYSAHFAGLPTEILRTEGIWLETAIDGIVIWEKDFEVSRFLGKIRQAIAEQKLVRKLSHGHPYWMIAQEDT